MKSIRRRRRRRLFRTQVLYFNSGSGDPHPSPPCARPSDLRGSVLFPARQTALRYFPSKFSSAAPHHAPPPTPDQRRQPCDRNTGGLCGRFHHVWLRRYKAVQGDWIRLMTTPLPRLTTSRCTGSCASVRLPLLWSATPLPICLDTLFNARSRSTPLPRCVCMGGDPSHAPSIGHCHWHARCHDPGARCGSTPGPDQRRVHDAAQQEGRRGDHVAPDGAAGTSATDHTLWFQPPKPERLEPLGRRSTVCLRPTVSRYPSTSNADVAC